MKLAVFGVEGDAHLIDPSSPRLPPSLKLRRDKPADRTADKRWAILGENELENLVAGLGIM